MSLPPDVDSPRRLPGKLGLDKGVVRACREAAEKIAAQVAEEIKDPQKNVPRTMLGSVVIGTVSGFLLCAALLFASPDMTRVLAAREGAFLFIISSATGSQKVTAFLAIFPIICLILGTTSIMTTASRMVWAFARDGGLPFSSWTRSTGTS